jgi:peptidoglycan/LPS O-acetylase OafA/YrhL
VERNNFLDCIRAFAALLVIACHAGFLRSGGIGVSIFFCLSGFLIATILLRMDPPTFPDVGRFVFRRFMRIWPLMAVQIVVTTILLSALATDNPISVEISDNLSDYLQSLLGLLTFTNVTNSNYLLSRSVLWTLQAEFWFYVTMALLALIGGRHAVFWFAFVGVGWLGLRS